MGPGEVVDSASPLSEDWAKGRRTHPNGYQIRVVSLVSLGTFCIQEPSVGRLLKGRIELHFRVRKGPDVPKCVEPIPRLGRRR